MQVISSQCSNSARSTSRSRKKGLSLTCRSRFSSQEKQSCTEEILQTIVVNQGQTQASINFQNVNEKISWLNENSRQTYQSAALPKTLADMPKITFRYTNETASSFQKVNMFSGKFSTTTSAFDSRGRPMNSSQMRKVVISNSVQTKNLNQSKIIPQSLISEANPKKQLIDSRRIDRQIIQEKVIAYLPALEQKITEVKIGLIEKSPEEQSIYFLSDSFNQNIGPQNEHKPRIIEQNLSPYHLLASSAKKNESKELSPGIRQQGSLQIMSLEKIPQVQQFNMNQNQDDGETAFPENTQSQKEQNQEEISVSDQQINFIDQVSIRVSEPVSLKSQMMDNVINQIEEKVLENNFFNVIEVPNITEKIKQPSNSPSPSRRQKERKAEIVLMQIENRAPQVQQGCSMSGRRNVKRIKQIEKRLEEIISICSNNL